MVGAALICGLFAWQAPSAFSWYSQISASMSCRGTVSWTASAWPGPTPDSRANPDVVVWASYDNGTTYTQIAQGAFDEADDYSFSGTFSAGHATSVLVKVHEEADWPGGGGDTPGPPHYATVTLPSNCSTTSTTASTPPSTPALPSRTGYCDASGKFWNLTVGQNSQPPYSSMGLTPAQVNPTTGAQYCTQPTPQPSRTGYCDASGKFWNLIVGQNSQPPYSSMHLRPADVNPQTGALYCAQPNAAEPVAQVKSAHHTIAKAKPKHRKTKKPKRVVPARKQQPHPATLPFTK
jgi:hypothetical protein